jgi:hypothetical protein
MRSGLRLLANGTISHSRISDCEPHGVQLLFGVTGVQSNASLRYCSPSYLLQDFNRVADCGNATRVSGSVN